MAIERSARRTQAALRRSIQLGNYRVRRGPECSHTTTLQANSVRSQFPQGRSSSREFSIGAFLIALKHRSAQTTHLHGEVGGIRLVLSTSYTRARQSPSLGHLLIGS